jgi:hypothetical protein
MIGFLLLGAAYSVTAGVKVTEREEREKKDTANLAILALQAKREEMRQFLLARGLLATEDILDKFRY